MKSSTWRDARRDVSHVAPSAAGRPVPTTVAKPLVALLIAGEPGQATLYGAKLRADGYTVVPAIGLERGIELASRVRPDLVFVCLGSWAVPALVLLVLRANEATAAVPTVLVADQTRARLSADVGGLLPTEHVVPRHAGLTVKRSTWDERNATGRPAGCGRPATFGRWLGL